MMCEAYMYSFNLILPTKLVEYIEKTFIILLRMIYTSSWWSGGAQCSKPYPASIWMPLSTLNALKHIKWMEKNLH